MTIWHERRGADLIFRLGGMVLLGSVCLLGTILASLVRSHAPHDPTPLDILVAMLMFAAGCLGTAALTLGKHLFDQVQVSDRWAVRNAKAFSTPDQSDQV